MTETDRSFYERRIREELQRAEAAEAPQLRHLHAWWAQLYVDRLGGKRISFDEAVRDAVRQID
jgi:hypothetical protein